MNKPKTTADGAPIYPKGMPVSAIHFTVHPGLPEVRATASAHGWGAVSAETEELHYTVDGWKTVEVVKRTDNPPPCAPDGRIFLAGVQHGTEVEFALKVGVHPAAAGARDSAVVWLNNGGQNYRQVTK